MCKISTNLCCILFSSFQGATLQYNDETGALEIARILHGGAADRSGELCFYYENVLPEISFLKSQ